VSGELSAHERECTERWCELLRERLGPRLLEIRLFGSAARGEMWPTRSPMHSDIDLLVLTADELGEELEDELGSETYALFLECGRQISPQFRTRAWLERPPDERAREFLDRIAADAVVLWPSPRQRSATLG
jgi:predicted nucleotidyltransferase